MSLFIHSLDFGFLKPLHRATQFLRFGRARIIHDTNTKKVVPIPTYHKKNRTKFRNFVLFFDIKITLLLRSF